MAKSELGTKRLCSNCGAKFYDLGKSPIVCPKCSTVQQLAAVAPRPRPDVAPRAPVKEEAELPEAQDAEFVSLEEADAEAEGNKKVVEGDEIEPVEDEIEIDPNLDDDDSALIEEQEETDDDVTDIIGDVEDEEEA